MGSRMAMSLLEAGHKITVWNRSLNKTRTIERAGAKVAMTPYKAAQDANFVINMVRDDEASKQVWLGNRGALAGMPQNAIAIESSTLSVAWTKKLGQQFARQEIAFLDAPVVGTRPQAETAQLIYFVSGDAVVFDRAKSILQAMGSVINYVGIVGSAMAIKLAVNSLFAVQAAAMGELISMMRQSGLNEAEALEIIASTPVCSPAAKQLAIAMIARKFAPLFPIELVAKDLSCAIATAEENQTKLPLVAATLAVFTTAIEWGYGADNITSIARLYI